MVWLVLCCSARDDRWDGALRGGVLSLGVSSGVACGAGLMGVVCDGVRDLSWCGCVVEGRGGAGGVCVLGRGRMVLHRRRAGQRKGEVHVGE
jgi:hypothetical protein